nr:hypothetical transcript [Hymenolepis microstoma]
MNGILVNMRCSEASGLAGRFIGTVGVSQLHADIAAGFEVEIDAKIDTVIPSWTSLTSYPIANSGRPPTQHHRSTVPSFAQVFQHPPTHQPTSVSPEEVGRRQAEVCASDVVVDAHVGAGGSTIQLAPKCKSVIGMDNDLERLTQYSGWTWLHKSSRLCPESSSSNKRRWSEMMLAETTKPCPKWLALMETFRNESSPRVALLPSMKCISWTAA